MIYQEDFKLLKTSAQLEKDGYLDITTSLGVKRINLERIHLEEDTARQFHIGENSYIDYNRAGFPLVEVVTRPDFTNAEEAMVFVEEIPWNSHFSRRKWRENGRRVITLWR